MPQGMTHLLQFAAIMRIPRLAMISYLLYLEACAAATISGRTKSSEGNQFLRLRAASPSECPQKVHLTRGDGTEGNRTIFTVSSWITHPDAWWTEEKLPDPTSMANKVYRIAASKLNNCGVIATQPIRAGQKIDLIWLPNDSHVWLPHALRSLVVHITPWFGYAFNHCTGASVNVEVVEMPDATVWAVASRNIAPGEELLANYNEAFKKFPLRIFPANPFWSC
mmetsp:Transcript_25632/g.41114  ORF Transcript_25632/g.41114 Transcript_25632/m.41114 type:complete len:223 (+) Transcript_25632:74-742(+)